jgi:HAD superfamily hydrolase (TIGR01450 family)
VKKFRHYLLDIEGTIVLDKLYTPVPGAVEWFNSLSRKGHYSRLVTNNTTESPDDLYDILISRGFKFIKTDYFTCLTEAVVQMRRRRVKSCLVLAMPSVKEYLRIQGIEPVEDQRAESVLVGYDPSLTYEKMNVAVSAIIENKAVLFTLHRNRRFVNEKREIAMSAGPITAALEYATISRAVVCGKPNRRFFLDSIKGWHVPREEILMVSDDPFADLIGARKLHMATCWVLTGSQRDPAAAELIPPKYRPDHILNTIVDIPL